jgi:S1-C subfamily serine protease
MRYILVVAAVVCVLVYISFSQAPAEENIQNCVVEISATSYAHDFSEPWKMLSKESGIGSGCIIEGQRILTNAHVVANHTFIEVRRAGQSQKFTAEVEAVSHELELALLKVSDDSFFDGVRPLEIGGLPRMGEEVAAYGFPTGGTRMTVTEGVVSRIDRLAYAHSLSVNLVCQIDAAINPGNSGGPVVSKGKIVGLAFQGESKGENIGYVVPAPVIEHFLTDIRDGRHDGAPDLPLVWQNLENPQIREYYGMTGDQSGVLVNTLPQHFMGEHLLEPKDIILAVDGCEVANDGTVELRNGERIGFEYCIERKQLNETISFDVLRKGHVLTREVVLDIPKFSGNYLVPRLQFETPPTYYVLGGLVFSPLTMDYLSCFDEVPSYLESYYKAASEFKTADTSDVVVLIGFLSDEANTGYDEFEDQVVSEVNGRKISGMKDFVRAIEEHEGEYHRIILEPYGEEIVLSKTKLAERNQAVLTTYAVPADRSADLGSSVPQTVASKSASGQN